MVLTRKVGEEVVIGNNIHITVVAVQGEKVRLGVSAPKGVVVDRQEVHEKRKNFFREGSDLIPTPTDLPHDLQL